MTAVVKEVLVIIYDCWAVELVQDSEQGASVPVICHPPTVVTLPSEVS